MEILILNWKDPLDPLAGGAEVYARRVAEEWAAAGHRVTMVVPKAPGLPAEDMRGAVLYRRLGNRFTVFPLARRFLRSNSKRFELVLDCVSTRPFLAHRVVGPRATALYHQMAVDVWNQEYRLPIALVGRYVLEPMWARGMRGARVVSVSPSTASDLSKHDVHVLAYVPPGCTVPPELPNRSLSCDPQILFLGRLSNTKRAVDAIRAFHRIRSILPTAHLHVVGEGTQGAMLRGIAGPSVTFHGRVDEPTKWSLLKAADIVLLPGTREGWGIVALEAAGAGVPVVAYDVPGLRDAVLDGVTGVICRPSPADMARATLRLLAAPPEWTTISAAARSRALTFTWERSATDLLAAMASSMVCSPTAVAS